MGNHLKQLQNGCFYFSKFESFDIFWYCDLISFMSSISEKNLGKIREKHSDHKIVFCSGSFDLVHSGHVLFFEDCKKLGDILVVSVGPDIDIKNNKGNNRPILNQHVRLKMVSSLKPVDYCFIGERYAPKKHIFYSIEKVLKKLKPDVWVVNADAFSIPDRKELAKKYGIKIVVLKRWCPAKFDNISTTKIIEKIKNTTLA